MSGSLILSLVTFIYGLAGFLYICAWIFRKQIFDRVATWIALVGLIGNTAGILVRWVGSYQLGIGKGGTTLWVSQFAVPIRGTVPPL